MVKVGKGGSELLLTSTTLGLWDDTRWKWLLIIYYVYIYIYIYVYIYIYTRQTHTQTYIYIYILYNIHIDFHAQMGWRDIFTFVQCTGQHRKIDGLLNVHDCPSDQVVIHSGFIKRRWEIYQK